MIPLSGSMLFTLLLVVNIIDTSARPFDQRARQSNNDYPTRLTTFPQYDCINQLGVVRDGKYITNGNGRTMFNEWVIERDHSGNSALTLEITMKNRFGGVMKKFKSFLPGGCRMQIMKCNLTDDDMCVPGTAKTWRPGFWLLEGEPIACPVRTLPLNQTGNTTEKRLAKRSPKGAKCFMTKTENNKSPTSCGSGEMALLLPLDEIAKEPADYSEVTMDNEADLILSRGDGQYQWQDIDLHQKFVCKKQLQ